MHYAKVNMQDPKSKPINSNPTGFLTDYQHLLIFSYPVFCGQF